jgi:organic hydroperoxide reductase OsmC/OhrA
MVEIVWDSGGAATCSAPTGARLHIGTGEPWAPEDLLAAAVSASVMQTFLTAALDARVAVLGYVASAALTVREDARPAVGVRACITVASGVTPAVVTALCQHARRTAPLSRMLASTTLTVSADVEVLTGAPA